jgi:hypothetical protein
MGGDDAAKNKVFNDLGIEDDVYSSRMYTLALFHTLLKERRDEEIFGDKVRDYYAFHELFFMLNDSVERGCPEGQECAIARMAGLETVYSDLLARHKDDAHTVLAHYDAKWDNWFQTESERENGLPGSVLGDFGNVASGTEYRDIARALLDRDTDYRLVKGVAHLYTHVADYIALRKYFENAAGCSWDVDNDRFTSSVKDHILLESVRIAGFQAKFTNDRKKVNDLLDVALNYAGRIDLNG